MTRTETKQAAQDALMAAMQNAFYAIEEENGDMTPAERNAISREASKQMGRVEKLFGYTPGSWGRG